MKKKILSLILVLAMVLPLIPVFEVPLLSTPVAAVTEVNLKTFQTLLEDAKNRFKDGEYFAGNFETGVSLTHTSPTLLCTGTNKNGVLCVNQGELGYCAGGGWCSCACGTYYYGGVMRAYQCWGFACQVGYDIFGIDSYGGWDRPNDANLIQPGDIVRYSWSADYEPHSIFVTNVIGDTIYYADCNAAGPCKVEWDNVTDRATIAALLRNRSDAEFGVYHAPNSAIDVYAPDVTYDSIDEGDYFLKNKSTGSYLAVDGGIDADQQNISVAEYTGGNEMKLAITAATRGYMMRPHCSESRIVNPYGTTVVSGMDICLWPNATDSTQWWGFEKVSGGYIVRNMRNQNIVLAVNGTEVTTAVYTGEDNQVWSLESAGGTITHTHTYDNACDATCNGCGETRTVAGHVYDNDCDLDCNICGKSRETSGHSYDNACDPSCNTCGATRQISGHVYDNACDAECNECRVVREVPDHVYSKVCDADCDVCGKIRSVTHTFDAEYDVFCNVCGGSRATSSGTTGSCKWYLMGTVLVISGNGAMGTVAAPWGTGITKAWIEPGVTSIGVSAFSGCKNLTSVSFPGSRMTSNTVFLPDSVTSIGNYAFYNCSSIEYIFLPRSVTSFGHGAFQYCKKLNTIVIPGGKTLSDYMFKECSSLRNLILPSSLTKIGIKVLQYCGKVTVWYEGSSTAYSEIDKNYYNSDLSDATKKYNCVLLDEKDILTGNFSYSNRPIIFTTQRIVIDGTLTLTNCELPFSWRITGVNGATVNLNNTYFQGYLNGDLICNNSGTKSTRAYILEGAEDITINYTATEAIEVDKVYFTVHDVNDNVKVNLVDNGVVGTLTAVKEGTVITVKGKTSTCEHIYSDECDNDCSECNGTREAPHVYDNTCDTDCNLCNLTRSITHTFDNGCDKECNVCGFTRTVPAHVYDNACDTECNECGTTRTVPDHVYDNACDKECNVCGFTRTVPAHVYDNACDSSCNICGYSRYVPDHVYDDALDTDCNVCGAIRIVLTEITLIKPTKLTYKLGEQSDFSGLKLILTYSNGETELLEEGFSITGFDSETTGTKTITVGYGGLTATFDVQVECATHTYDNACDTDCNECGFVRTITHDYSVQDKNETEHWMKCSVCGVIDEASREAHIHDNACDPICDECGYVRTITHAYDNACDIECNVCKEIRNVSDHIYDNASDTSCNECGTERIVATGISVKTAPSKTVYEMGETLDTEGLAILLSYSNGTTETITEGFTVSGFESETAGAKTVTVNYGEFSTSFTVTVNQKVVIDENAPQVVIRSKRVTKGQQFTVAVEIKNNPGIASVLLNLTYDESVLTLVEVNDTQLISGGMHSAVLTSPYQLTWINGTMTENITANGAIVNLVFKANENAEIGDYRIELSYDYENYDIINTDMEPVLLHTVGSTITVSDFIYGDVNGDGRVNLLDSTILARHVAKWPGYSENDLDMQAADVNNDGRVNLLDSTILARHIAKWPDYAELPYAN